MVLGKGGKREGVGGGSIEMMMKDQPPMGEGQGRERNLIRRKRERGEGTGLEPPTRKGDMFSDQGGPGGTRGGHRKGGPSRPMSCGASGEGGADPLGGDSDDDVFMASWLIYGNKLLHL